MNSIYAEVITIGDEILYGQITDTNSAWISSELSKIGIRTIRKSSVGDDEIQLTNLLIESEKRAHLIIITGGLGPTKDDITKQTLAKFYNSSLQLHEEALKQVDFFFTSRGKELTDINKLQAYIPEVCTYIPNRSGTAPGMWFERNGVVLVSLPGVPFEMKSMMEEEVLPRLIKHFNPPHILHRFVRTIGIGESVLAEKLRHWENNLPEGFKLAYLPSPGEVKLRLSASGEDEKALAVKMDVEIEIVKKIIPEYIYAYNEDAFEKVIGDLLRQKGLTIATAESCTGGYIAHLLTSIPGSSDYYIGSVIAYQNSAKTDLLSVSVDTLRREGAVSEAVAIEMAQNVRIKFKADVALATTGIMGPGGATPTKPLGTFCMAFADSIKTVSKKIMLSHRRDYNIKLASYAALNLLRQHI